ncbi:hypothetical protein [Microtetraspora sp. NBRC 16547]|uniref:hypothetical protein n=1 Tax=Microtetraspora sp. NBRC 16547 TaxID=3030993 RepID=UPI0024A5836C|nr:hypothetical protein [Microtetraspora sp. NBRC 16547]GLW96679.1 hypothetical protein Misp02_07660 [Microtetraspora sp. NBRC 16547]
MILTLALSASLAMTGSTAHVATKPVTFQGFTIQVPLQWHVKKEGVNLRVITGACSPQAAECQSFLLGGAQAIKYASEGNPYRTDQAYHPSSGVTECVPMKKYFSGQATRVKTSKAAFGTGQQALFTEWKVSCDGSKANAASYTQRVWYVKAKKVIVVDHWKTPELGAILAKAVWE